MPHAHPGSRSALRRTVAAAVAAGSLVAGLAACSSGSAATASDASGGSAASTAAVSRVHVTITAAKGCTASATKLAAGGVAFTVDNKDAAAVSEVEVLSGERIVGEKENIPPGFSGQFAATLTAGDYTLYCPGGTPERSPLTASGKFAGPTDATTAALLKQATVGYAGYVKTQEAALLLGVRKLDTALHGTNLAAAQTAYMRARPFYEKIEPVAESFVIGKDVIDADIDARINNVLPGQKWTGFHRIEQSLFADKSLTGMTYYGDKLVSDVQRLQKLSATLTFQPTELANGAAELLDEVATTKITGEEERYSHIDLLDFANNDEGAEQAFAQLAPALKTMDPSLTATIQRRFTALDTLVDHYRTESNPSGFEYYGQLTANDKRALSAAVAAVQSPLAQVGGKVATA